MPLHRDHHDGHVLQLRHGPSESLGLTDALRRSAGLDHAQAPREGNDACHWPRLAERARGAACQGLGQVSLFLFVLAHAMGKLTTIPLLLKTSPAALAASLGGAMAIYLFYKLARRDFQYWIPTAGAGVSLISRVFGKLYVDFSGKPPL